MLPRSIVERVLRRRGKLNILDTFPPRKTALLAIDLQNAYLAEDQPGYLQAGRGIISNVNRLAAVSDSKLNATESPKLFVTTEEVP